MPGNDVTKQESVGNIVSESDLFTERDEDYINNMISSIFNSNEEHEIADEEEYINYEEL